jgi:trafficking protein particle complex subunit 8
MEGSQFLRSATAPLIAVSCSSQTKTIAEKNQIPDFCQFLRPFGERISSLTTQDVNGFPVVLNPCFLRFQMLDKCDPISFDFKQIIQLEGDKLPVLKTKTQVEEWRENAVPEHLTPWYHLYRALLSKYLGASEHETFNHPVARLLVVSSSDSDAVGIVKNMLAAPLPAIFSKGYIDPAMPIFILLVHDPEEALQIE